MSSSKIHDGAPPSLSQPSSRKSKNALTADRDFSLSKKGSNHSIPKGARWTKISREVADPEALEVSGKHYEEVADEIVVLGALTKSEITAYVNKTSELRNDRAFPTPPLALASEPTPEYAEL